MLGRVATDVTAKTSIAFYGWSIETGPLLESNEEIWQEIDKSLVSAAAGPNVLGTDLVYVIPSRRSITLPEWCFNSYRRQ
jgi:hypothetical protein